MNEELKKSQKKVTTPKKSKKTKVNTRNNLNIEGINEINLTILATRNNTIVSATMPESHDKKGCVLFTISSGQVSPEGGKTKFANSRKRSPMAAQRVLAEVAQRLIDRGIFFVNVRYKGVGPGRDSNTISVLYNKGIRILTLEDQTSYPCNGCRNPKARKT
jgi:ribosomal protein S11